MFCKKCGKEILDDASTQDTAKLATNDAPSTGMAVLGFFIPLAGLIVWLINKDSKPQMAKSAGKGALVGIIVSIIFSIIYGAVVGSLIGSMAYYY